MKPTIVSAAAESLTTLGRVDHRPDRAGVPRTEPEDGSRYLRTGPRSDRAVTLQVAAREYIWLYDRRHGVSFENIAAREGVSVDRVRFGVKRAEAQESRLSKDDLTKDLKPGRTDELG